MASFAAGLGRAGHDVHVVTAKPNYPSGRIFPGYRKGWFQEGSYADCRVTRTWIWADTEKSFVGRLLYYLSFVVFAVVAVLRDRRRRDVVVASSPPLFVGLAGWLAARITGARYVFDVRDLWPDVAVAMGELPDGLPARLAGALERFIYRRADAVTAATESFCRDIRERTPLKTPVWHVPNGTVPSLFAVDTEPEELRRELGLPDGFLVTYAGNLGLAQGLELVLDAAELTTREDVRFLLVGDGSDRDRLRAEAEARGLENVVFRDRVPLEEAARYMAASDALLVPLQDREIYRKFVPSKLYDCMAAGRPVLLSVDGEARRVLEAAEGGIFCPPSEPGSLAAAVDCLRDEPRRVESMERHGAVFVRKRYDRRVIAAAFARQLETAFGSRDAAAPPAGQETWPPSAGGDAFSGDASAGDDSEMGRTTWT